MSENVLCEIVLEMKKKYMSWRHNCKTQTREIVETTTIQMMIVCNTFSFSQYNFIIIHKIKKENVMLLFPKLKISFTVRHNGSLEISRIKKKLL